MNTYKNTLGNKHYEPLIVRRCVHSKAGVTYFVAMICGDDLDKLDEILLDYEEYTDFPLTLQGQRDWVGRLAEKLLHEFRQVEGVAVILYSDKVVVSSLCGDFMNHMGCRQELYSILNFMNGV